MSERLAGLRLIRQRVFPLALVALAVVARVFALGREGLWLDEISSVNWARLSLSDLIPTLITQDVHPPLYFFLLHFWVQLVGHSEFAVRMFSALAGGLTVPVLYRIGRMTFGARAGGLAALLLALSQFHVHYSQETRAYSLFTLLTTLSFYLLLRWQTNRTAPLAAAYGVTSALVLYTHTYGFFVLAAHNLGWLIGFARMGTRAPAPLRQWALMQVSVLILYLPWGGILIGKVSQADCFYCVEPSLASLITFFYYYLGSPWAFGLALAGLAVRGYEAARARLLKAATASPEAAPPVGGFWLTGVWMMSLHAWPLLLSVVFTPIYLSRATLPALPAFLLLLIGAIAGIRLRVLRLGLIAALIVAHLATLLGYYGLVIRQQWREMGQRISAEARPGDLVLLYPGYAEVGFDYYTTRADLRRVALADDAIASASEARALIGQAGRVWLVTLERPEAVAQIETLLAPTYRRVLAQSYVGLDVLLLEKAP